MPLARNVSLYYLIPELLREVIFCAKFDDK